MRILQDVDAVYGLPVGWHPAVDAIRGQNSHVPVAVAGLLRELYGRRCDFFEALALEPYEWGAATDWGRVAGWLRLQLETLPVTE